MKNGFRLVVSLILILSVLVPIAPSTNIAKAATHEVSLLNAELYNPSYSCPMSICGSVKGEIEVLNLAYAKKVSVVFSTGNNVWVEAPASYTASIDNNVEVWNFNTRLSALGTSYIDKPIQLAVKYVVNGRTYWDNNGGQDYRFGGANQPWKMLFKSALAYDCTLGAGCFSDSTTIFAGRILLKNLAYSKNVKVFYTTDSGKTYKQVTANFNSMVMQSNNALEYWSFEIKDTNLQAVQFYLTYTVNGVTYTDNNHKRLHTLFAK